MSWLLVACLLCMGLVPRIARAQQDEFKRYFNAAIQLYKRGETERAQEQLQRAKQRARELQQDVAVAVYEGLILADLGQREQALAAFETALLLDPEAQLPPMVSPKLKVDFEAVRARVRPPPSPPAPKPEPQVKKDPPSPPRLDPPPPSLDEGFKPSAQVAGEARTRAPVVPLVLAGVGVVAAGMGTVLGLQSRANTASVRDAYEGPWLPTSAEVNTVGANLDDARGQARMANVMFGTAALAVGGAIVTWWLTSDDSSAKSTEGH